MDQRFFDAHFHGNLIGKGSESGDVSRPCIGSRGCAGLGRSGKSGFDDAGLNGDGIGRYADNRNDGAHQAAGLLIRADHGSGALRRGRECGYRHQEDKTKAHG